ncbi:MAG: arginine repressor [Clostridia bacterium]|nr:arginine repressor [Clostridia bacterium]
MKAKRQAAILDIIRNQHIDTQEELTNALSAVGFAVTQATVSRDIKELRLIKTLSADGRYHYAAAAPIHTESSSAKLHTLFRDAVHSVDYACNIVVVKCMAGTAGAVCTAADSMNLPSIVGSLAGDDTIMFVVRSEAEAARLVHTFRDLSAHQ